VTVLTKRSDTPAVRWDSDGEASTRFRAAANPIAARKSFFTFAMRTKSSWSRDDWRQLVRKYRIFEHPRFEDRRYAGDLESSEGVLDPSESELKDEDYQASTST